MRKCQSGQASRRDILRGGLAVVAGGGFATAAAAQTLSERQRLAERSRIAQAAQKIAQSAVQYQQTPGTGGAKCSTCVNWEPPNACKIIDGTINPEGWCIAYAPKSS